MIRTLLSLLFDCIFHVPSPPRTVMRHPGGRQAGYGYLAMAAVAAYQGYNQSQSADAAANAASGVAEKQGALATKNDHRADQMMSLYDQYGLPELKQYIKATETPVNADEMAAKAGAQVDQEAAGAYKNLQRQDLGYGMDPNSGEALSQRANFNLNEAVAKAGAMTSARNNAINLTLARLNAGVGAGQSLMSGAESFTGNSISGYNSAGGIFANTANIYGDQAAGWGELAGYGLSRYMQQPPPQAPQAPQAPSTAYPPQ